MDYKNESRQKYRDINENVRDRADKMTRSGKDVTSKEFTRFGSALHAAADNLNASDDYFAGFVDSMANRVDDFSHYISDREPKEVLNSVQSFAKKYPAITIGGMFVAGMAASRFLKAGTEHQSDVKEEYYESGA